MLNFKKKSLDFNVLVSPTVFRLELEFDDIYSIMFQ